MNDIENKFDMPKAETCGFVPTLNSTGYMTSDLDPCSNKFVELSGRVNRVLEIGAAYGVATLKALQNGANIVCNDLDKRHLQIINSLCPEQYKENLELHCGAFPMETNFSNNSFDAILISRVLHFFTGELILESLQKCYDWLTPGGRIFIVCETPFMANWHKFLTVYERRVLNGDLWPGFMSNASDYHDPDRLGQIPEQVHFMDDTILRRVLLDTGFKIEELSYLNRADFPEDMIMDGRESIAAIAIKA